MDRMKWFEEARFGMFIHWGVYAEAGRGEWVRNIERISNEDYQQYVEADGSCRLCKRRKGIVTIHLILLSFLLYLYLGRKV